MGQTHREQPPRMGSFISRQSESEDKMHHIKGDLQHEGKPVVVDITYCRNCDGGDQEKRTAIAAVEEALPGCSLNVTRLDSYPVQVTVSTKSFGGHKVIWTGAQRNLFSKYPQLRSKAMAEIVETTRSIAKQGGLVL